MIHIVSTLAVLAIGFGIGRIHHISQLKTKLLAFEATAVGDVRAAYQKIRSIL